MRVLLALVASLATAASLPVSGDYENVEFSYPYHDNETFMPDENQARALRKSSDSDIKYQFYSQESKIYCDLVTTNTIHVLKNVHFRNDKDTLFVVHGWNTNVNVDWIIALRTIILELYDINLFIVDWDVFAKQSYVIVRGSVNILGEYLAIFVRLMECGVDLDLKKVKFVGHSFGAHICGVAGRSLKGRVKVITALDPAGPLFGSLYTYNRLSSWNAGYVQVIHTSLSSLGANYRLGDSDYYPNGGRSQPGCGTDTFGACAHKRAVELYIDSLNNSMWATKCDSFEDYIDDQCDDNPESLMGGFEVDTSASGTYYLTTYDKPPY